ncbi:MAG: hypothetical protein A2Y62_11500 [Candidatus Fischerbacteria bacterium RBG_13_37_8]|uniref:Uncharacterized protein n=1 Tax=Candidatus Fischerbacteria bacterium RBG_13_37_8 TaxID=1817863 RepID=A0A1F5VXX2_9BACT|nr:MAG: hypothetical protein A2Y62_11500 [Candidatus Fischerbacteria bacterium RBG_13_37_8]
MENLDRLCAEYGYEFAEAISDETLFTKALGVLQEQGIYSFVLFCKSRGSTERPGSEKIEATTKKILKNKLELIGNGDLLEEIRGENGLASRLDDLILAMQVLEKSLIYARYHVKAKAKCLE